MHKPRLSAAVIALSFAACAADPAAPVSLPLDEARQQLEADEDGEKAIHARHASIPPALREEYFDRALTDALSTADGRGAFRFFEGSSGVGAIYSNPHGATWDEREGWHRARVTEPVYGEILQYWAAYGYESVLGYPSSPEYAVDDTSALREQRFGELVVETAPAGRTRETATLRWTPEHGVWAQGYLGAVLDGSEPTWRAEWAPAESEPAWLPPCRASWLSTPVHAEYPCAP